VLSRFKPDERTAIDDAVRRAADGCRVWLTSGVELAMNRVNV
jgi:peptidyl-tRNA hydrolase